MMMCWAGRLGLCSIHTLNVSDLDLSAVCISQGSHIFYSQSWYFTTPFGRWLLDRCVQDAQDASLIDRCEQHHRTLRSDTVSQRLFVHYQSFPCMVRMYRYTWIQRCNLLEGSWRCFPKCKGGRQHFEQEDQRAFEGLLEILLRCRWTWKCNVVIREIWW